MKYGLVLEGGAMRGLFTAGILDVLMENDIVFDKAAGVSAGEGSRSAISLRSMSIPPMVTSEQQITGVMIPLFMPSWRPFTSSF